jgi:hypothetical protein
MNRTEIAQQVSTTLGDFVDDYDMDAILDDLIDADVTDSIDDVDTTTYWEIVRRHDLAARVMEEAEKAHAAFIQAEEDYKAALSLRQFVFARTVDTMGRGGNARLARELELSAPTVKSIADRGRAMDKLSPEYAAQFPYIRPECKAGTCDHAPGRCERMRSEDCRHGDCDHGSLRLHCAELPSRPGLPAYGWELS